MKDNPNKKRNEERKIYIFHILPFGKNSVTTHNGFKQTPKNWTMLTCGRSLERILHSLQNSDKSCSFIISLLTCLIATSDRRLQISIVKIMSHKWFERNFVDSN